MCEGTEIILSRAKNHSCVRMILQYKLDSVLILEDFQHTYEKEKKKKKDSVEYYCKSIDRVGERLMDIFIDIPCH